MKIKVAFLENDKTYLSRIISTFETKYAEKFELYSFTDKDVALSCVDSARIDVLLANNSFSINPDELPSRCAFAYLVDSNGIESIGEVRAICKFQRADLIYKQILSLYAEKASDVLGFSPSEGKEKILIFTSPCGGVGTSSMAAACAVQAAAKGKKVLYLNLEKFGGADLFFDGSGQFCLSDIIMALKSKKTNLPLKLESCVRQDPRNVFYYAQARNALDVMELTGEEILQLISAIRLRGEYDHIIIDMDFEIKTEILNIYRQARSIIFVSDGSVEANEKVRQAYRALTLLEQTADMPLTNRIQLIYNRFSSNSGQILEIPGLKVLGGAPRYAGGKTQQVIEELSRMAVLGNVL